STPYMNELRQFAGYKRGQMLNHKVHGPGIDKNLVPISTATNKDMETGIEKKLKELVISGRRVVRFTVATSGWGNYSGAVNSPLERELPTQFDFTLEQMGPQNPALRGDPDNWTVVKQTFNFPV